jgi:hypothetical protein
MPKSGSKQAQRRTKPDAGDAGGDGVDDLDLRMMPEALDQARAPRLCVESVCV